MESVASSLETPVTVFTLLAEARAFCEANQAYSLGAAHRYFEKAFRDCTRPTTRSSPSFEFFGDWVARKSGLTKCNQGIWQPLPLDCWQIINGLFADDREAYFQFWNLLQEFCQLDERVVETFVFSGALSIEGMPVRCELRQLNPEVGVYCRCYFRDDERVLGQRIENYGFFYSADVAKLEVRSKAKVPTADWRPE